MTVPGIGSIDRGVAQEPRQGELGGVASCAAAASSSDRRAEPLPLPTGAHGMKPMPSRAQTSSTSSLSRSAEVVAVLHRRRSRRPTRRPRAARPTRSTRRCGGSCPVSCSSFSAPIDSVDRHLRVEPVELVEVDAVELQAPQRHLDALAQVLGPADGLPHARAAAREAALGGDDQAVGVRVQRLGDEVLAHERPVGVGGVDEVDAQLDGPAQHADATRRGRPGRPRSRRR